MNADSDILNKLIQMFVHCADISDISDICIESKDGGYRLGCNAIHIHNYSPYLPYFVRQIHCDKSNILEYLK